jgi:hypothetical protein
MSRILAAALLALLGAAAFAAPIPPPKPGLNREMQELLKSAEADMARARALEKARPDSRAVAIEGYALARKAGAKADRLLGGLAKAPKAARARAARVGSEAWRRAGESGKALPHCEALVGCADTARERVEALGRVAECLVTTGRLAEARQKLAAAQKELPGVGGKEGAAWQRWLSGPYRKYV